MRKVQFDEEAETCSTEFRLRSPVGRNISSTPRIVAKNSSEALVNNCSNTRHQNSEDHNANIVMRCGISSSFEEVLEVP
jgi:hypothetical protein